MEDVVEGRFAQAWREAEERLAAAEEAERLKAEAALAAVDPADLVYDPLPYPEAEPHDPSLYEGTGIGALYGVPGCEHFLADLGPWKLGKEVGA